MARGTLYFFMKKVFIKNISQKNSWRFQKMFIDTHCHMNMMGKKEFDVLLKEEHFPKIKEVVEVALQNGIEKIINVGTSLPESINCVEIAKRFDNVFAIVGIHPCDATKDWMQDFKEIKKLVQRKEELKIVGIGEIGMDFYHKPFDKDRQRDAFKAQIELALENDLPISFHVRDAADEFLRALEEYVKEIKGGVIHCFCQKQDFADVVLGWGLYVGIDGPITYPKNDWFREIVADIPLNRILLETDAPFLPPQQFRGKQNHPAYIPIFAQTVADLHNVSLEKLAEVTTNNAENLFSI